MPISTGSAAHSNAKPPPRPRLDAARLERLLEIGQLVVSDLEMESVLHTVLGAACALTGARYAAVGVLDADRRSLERFVTFGIGDEAMQQIGDLPRGRGVLGVLIDESKPLRLSDVGMHPESYGFPVGHPPMQSFLGVPVVIRGEPWGNLYLTEKDGGGAFDEADEVAIVALARWAATAIENARLYRGEQDRRGELERAVRGLEATTEIARAVGGETQLDRVLELVVKRGRALVEARGLAILLADQDMLVVTAIAGQVPSELLGTRIATSDSAGGSVMRSRRPERVSDSAPRLRFAVGETTGARAGLLVPLVFRGRALGVLEAFDRITDGPEFSADDQRLMEAFAASAATAVATAQDVAAETLRRSIDAADHERSHWARELHDDALQELGALKLTLKRAQRLDDPDATREAIDEAIGFGEHAIQALREIISDLRPAALDTLGAQAALEALAERASTRSDLRVELRIDLAYESGRAATRHTPELEAAIYRIVQEAITNVHKHAQASTVIVAIAETTDTVELSIEDDGCGFDHSATTTGSFGLIGMRERVTLLDGTLTVASEPGNGTKLAATIPSHRHGPVVGLRSQVR